MKTSFPPVSLAIVLVIALWLPGTSMATDLGPAYLRIKIQRAGILKFVTSSLVESRGIPGGKEKKGLVIEITQETDRIPANRGVTFGFQYEVDSKVAIESVSLDIRLKPPPLIDPSSGRAVSEINYHRIARTNRSNFTGYGLDYDWELVPGRWVFQILYKGDILAEQAFEVYLPNNK